MKYLSSFLLLILISCSNGEIRKETIETPYQTSGVEQFFLPELPAWANSSPSGECFKKSSFQYLDFVKISHSYQLEYVKFLELQAQYNERLETYFRSTSVRFLKPVEQAAFFSNTLENVRGGVRSFKLPPLAKKVDIIWLDRYIALNLVDELRKMSETGRFDERVPILFTSCMSRQDLNQWLVENNMEQIGLYSLSAEWLSPFGSEAILKPGLHVEVKKLLGPDVEVRFLAPNAILLPTEIVL